METDEQTSTPLRTGIKGLDDILRGGISHDCIDVV